MLKVHGHEIFQDFFSIMSSKSKILQICSFFSFPLDIRIFAHILVEELTPIQFLWKSSVKNLSVGLIVCVLTENLESMKLYSP
jgi:hypothetical protein